MHCHCTALEWLQNSDAHREEFEHVLRDVYGDDSALWMRRWRCFFLASAGSFGYADWQRMSRQPPPHAGRFESF